MNDTRYSRRRFISTAACSAGVLAPGVARLATLSASVSDAEFPSPYGDVAIAYQRDSESIATLFEARAAVEPGTEETAPLPELPRSARLVDARGIASGDSAFAHRGARVTIRGIAPRAGTEIAPVEMFAHSLEWPVPVRFWSADSAATLAGRSSGAMTIPVSRREGFALSFEIGAENRESQSLETLSDQKALGRQVFARFAIDGARGTPKLRRGIYVVRWSDRRLSKARCWDRCVLDLEEQRLIRSSGQGSELKAACALVSVDYAS